MGMERKLVFAFLFMEKEAYMQTVKLSNGIEVPVLGFGTWQLKGVKCTEMVEYALKSGYRAIDTAQIYLNEEAVGEGIRRSEIDKSEIFLTTKVRNRFQGYDTTLKAVEASLQRFGLNQIDLFLVHWPGKRTYLPTWKALVRFYEEGLIRSIGVSNFYPEHLETCAQETGIMPMINQIEMHPYLIQHEIVDYCEENHIVLESWSPLSAAGQSRKDPKCIDPSKTEEDCENKNPMEDPLIKKIAQKHGKTPAQIILNWHVQKGFVVVPKSSNPKRILQNMEIFDFELTEEEMKAIDELTKRQIRIGDDSRYYEFPLLKDLIAQGKELERDSFGNIL